MLLNKEQVMSFLPHRDPFLFVDTVEEIILPNSLKKEDGPFTPQQIVGGTCICTFNVTEDMAILKGHFPGNPILPGVVQVEMMAQAASFLCIYCIPDFQVKANIEVALLSVDGAKFRKPIKPGMKLIITSTLIKARGPILSYECSIQYEDDVVSEANVLASIKFL